MLPASGVRIYLACGSTEMRRRLHSFAVQVNSYFMNGELS